jgi:tRNA dimethylallyltransferase
VGLILARLLDAEIVALDSMTLYRGMDIGTAKPTPADRNEVPHHLIDVLDPWESASVADYRAWATAEALEVERRGRRVLFVGGTGLYLKALLRGLFEGPGADSNQRQELEADANRLGLELLHARLERLDPATAARLHPNDRRRVIRALEVIGATGRKLSELQQEHDQPAPENVAVVALVRPREELNRRIDARVETMFQAGLIDEVRTLQSGPQPIGRVPAQGVGYREVLDWLAGRPPYDRGSLLSRVQTHTRQFAKRQMTWFRGLSEVRPWPIAGDEPPETTAQRLACMLGQCS